jgi:predicted HAD superfamily hydrolase
MNTLIKNKEIKLYSFDIFDTLVTRRVGLPRGIFAIMQNSIKSSSTFSEDFRNNFYTIRIESEIKARENSDFREISFENIYYQMKQDFNLSDEDCNYLKSLEIQTELENLVGIEENILKIKSLIEKEERVVLISDMYYSEKTLRMFLSHISPIFEKIKIYVSSEYKTSKHEGKLYKIVQSEEKISPKEWLHKGDNKISDIKRAKSLKIQTEYFEFSPLTKYEEELLTLYPENLDFYFLVGASRIARLNKNNNQEKYDFGASFAAPVLYNYINWILDNTIKKEFKTLHFIARDGYIPKIVADMIIKKRGLNINTKYIYGSRLAWRIPSEENYELFIQFLMEEYSQKLSLSFLAYRLHIDVSQINQYLNIKNPEKIFNETERNWLRKELIYNPKIKQAIIQANQERINLLLDYIKQEISLDKDIAFVDVNGSGKTQDILNLYINKISNSTVHTFYLSSNCTNEKGDISKKYTYCKNPKQQIHYCELLFRSLGGQTVGYKKDNNIILPIRENLSNNAILEWGFESYVEGIKDFTDIILNIDKSIDDVNLCYLYQDYITTKCDYATAVILGDIPFATIGDEKDIKKAAPELSLWQILLLTIKGKQIEEISEFPHITIVRGNFISNFVKQLLLNIQKTPKLFIEIKLYLLLKSLKNQTIMFWGASLWLEHFIKKYRIKNNNVLGIIDKNPNRQGNFIDSYQIFSPEELKNQKPNYILMTIKNHNKSIYSDLKNNINENYQDVKLLPNIFETKLL